MPVKLGSTSGSKTQVKLPGSLCTRPIPTSSTWPSRGKFGGPVKSVASIDRQTEGIPGNRFCRLMMRRAQQTSQWILATHELCTHRCGSTVEPPGSSSQAAQQVGFTKPQTGVTAGRSWVAAFLSSLVKQVSMYLPAVRIAFMQLSKPRSIKVVCGAVTTMVKPGLCSITSESFGLALGITSI